MLKIIEDGRCEDAETKIVYILGTGKTDLIHWVKEEAELGEGDIIFARTMCGKKILADDLDTKIPEVLSGEALLKTYCKNCIKVFNNKKKSDNSKGRPNTPVLVVSETDKVSIESDHLLISYSKIDEKTFQFADHYRQVNFSETQKLVTIVDKVWGDSIVFTFSDFSKLIRAYPLFKERK